MRSIFKLTVLSTLFVLLQSCKTVDLRSDYLKDHSAEANMFTKGKELLLETNAAMGYSNLVNVEVFEATANFSWTGALLVMPMNSFPGNNNKDVQLRFATNTFDGQVEYLEGRKKNQIYGLQSWQGYKFRNNRTEVEASDNDHYNWGLAAYHYILEAPMRLLKAEIIKYAGERELNGELYDLVFASWGSEQPNEEYDQFLLYINKETKFVDLVEITIGDFFLPMPKGMQHGTVRFPNRVKTEIGTYLPTEVVIQIGKPKDESRGAYRFKLRDFKFDSFHKDILYPLKGIKSVGDSKPVQR